MGPLITPGGEWAAGSPALWKYSTEAMQTQGAGGRLSEVGAVIRPFAFLDFEGSPLLAELRRTQLVTWLML